MTGPKTTTPAVSERIVCLDLKQHCAEQTCSGRGSQRAKHHAGDRENGAFMDHFAQNHALCRADPVLHVPGLTGLSHPW